MSKFNRVVLIIMDSAGVGALPDAEQYGDTGANTLGNIAQAVGGLQLPTMTKMGLGNIIPLRGVPAQETPIAAFGKLAEYSAGKDTTTGHWEIAGILLDQPFPTYPGGFPTALIAQYEQLIGRKTLGNVAASGTEIIEQLGQRHLETGYPIVYTSADSVFQIAAHEAIIPIEQLYNFCQIARDLLTGEHAVGRVIARPFVGQPGSFQRTERRHDYSLVPPHATLLDLICAKNLEVMAVGKIKDIFAQQGVSQHKPAKNNGEGLDKTLEFLSQGQAGLIFTNLVDFDMVYGHRNNAQGYATALQEFDARLPEIMACLQPTDLLMISADHGCDPTTQGTDHTREYIPLLVYGAPIKGGVNVGIRPTFADLGATVAEALGLQLPVGTSFLQAMLK